VKVCVLGAAFDTGNMGVNALAAGTVRCILHGVPAAEVCFLNYAKSRTVYTIKVVERQVTVPLVNLRFSWRFWLHNNIAFLLFLVLLTKLAPLAVLRRRWIARNDCLRLLNGSDLVLAISGGDSFSDIYGLGRFAYVSLPQILTLWLGKRLVLLPQTIGPFKRRATRAVAKYIIKRADVTYSRDHDGVEQVKDWLGPGVGATRLRFCYDLGFALDPTPPAWVNLVGLPSGYLAAKRLVGLNVSGLLWMGGYSRKNEFELRTDYRSFIYALVHYLVERKQANVILIPHVIGTGGECDSPVCDQLFEVLKTKYPNRIGVLRGSYSHSELKFIIGSCDFFVGARMHACIAALSEGTPAVATAYSNKFAGVLDTVGIGALVTDLRMMQDEEILSAIGDAFDHRAALRCHLERIVPRIKQYVLDLFKNLAEPTGNRRDTPVTIWTCRSEVHAGLD
jgi:polysaccharide pyruvyl transferase WcaK-like protein